MAPSAGADWPWQANAVYGTEGGMKPVFDPQPVTLANAYVTLSPMQPADRDALAAAAADPRVTRFIPIADIDHWLKLQAARAYDSVPFTVRLGSQTDEPGKVVGSTSYLGISRHDRRLEVGSTWYHPSVWAGPVNPSCKLLLFAHAFETLGAERVELKCDARNERSRAAILKLGAKQEGIFRRHMLMHDGHQRDTVFFSVIAEEWPTVKAGLLARLAPYYA